MQNTSPNINLSFQHQLIIIFTKLQQKFVNKMAQTRSRSRQQEIEEEEEENLNEFQEALRGNTNEENPSTPTPVAIERAQHNPLFNQLFDEILRKNTDLTFYDLPKREPNYPLILILHN